MASLRWTREAELWLKDIHEHIALDNPAAANHTLESIIRKAGLLIEHPKLGYRFSKASPEVRILLHDHYRIVYSHDPSGDVAILGVYHGALDLERYLTRDAD